MRRISTADLREREVINLCGGERLGYPCDFEIDLDEGKILSIIVRGGNSSFFGKKEECIIPWCKIECIGEDTILVKVPQSELFCNENRCRSKHKGFFSH